jgi:2-succinyl-5-enolpyruvyl-6-hydroxy-3-cyclohexene-1-carboxylate synthase
MYSNFFNVQILIALLKEYGIHDVVLSPGGSDIPMIHSIETDDFFCCYSVVDERSAAYFAMGVAQQKNKAVACVCTSGTAVCNYVPGITEAFYQNVPIVAITCDKNPNYQGQLETQKIDQKNILDGVVKKSVDLPFLNNEEAVWLCNRLVNEALLETSHHGKGPVHINIPIVGATDIYNCEKLPPQRVIRYGDIHSEFFWDDTVKKLHSYQIIMVVFANHIY